MTLKIAADPIVLQCVNAVVACTLGGEVCDARLKHGCVEGYQGRNLTQKPSGLCQGEVAFGADLGCSSSYSIEVGDEIVCLKTGVWSRFSCQQLLNRS